MGILQNPGNPLVFPMQIKIVTLAAMVCLSASRLAAAAPNNMDADLPAGTRAAIRLEDYVNTEHQPKGFTYRGSVVGDVVVGGKVVVPNKAKVLLRLAAGLTPVAGGIPVTAQALTVDWWAVKFEGDWAEFRSVGAGPAPGLFTVLTSVEDRRLVSKGPGSLYIPFHSILQFELRTPVRLLNVGRYKP